MNTVQVDVDFVEAEDNFIQYLARPRYVLVAYGPSLVEERLGYYDNMEEAQAGKSGAEGEYTRNREIRFTMLRRALDTLPSVAVIDAAIKEAYSAQRTFCIKLIS